MAQKKGAALLVVYADVDVEHDAEFNAWYNEEHVPRTVERPWIPGTLPVTKPCAAAPVISPSMSWNRRTPCKPLSTGT